LINNISKILKIKTIMSNPSCKRAFKKLPKSIPKALKKDLTESKDMKIRHQLIKAKYF